MSHRRSRKSCGHRDECQCAIELCCPPPQPVRISCMIGPPGEDQEELPVGTILVNAAGGPGTTLYLKEGPGAAGWRAL